MLLQKPKSLQPFLLEVNDTVRNVSEWSTMALQYLGTKGHGKLVTYYIVAGAAPAAPIMNLHEPVKPDAANINLLLEELNLAADAPRPSLLSLQRAYLSSKEAYELEKDRYKYDMEIFRNFSSENEKAFSDLRALVSDVSHHRIISEPEGSNAFLASNTFTYYAVAITVHSNVDDRTAENARKLAKAQLKACVQADSDTSSYISEWSHRYLQYKKLHPLIDGSAYSDEEKRQALLDGLNSSHWGAWIKTRKDAGTMPYTFEALVDNLQTESANRINEAVALSTNDVRAGRVDKIDFKATHATSSDPASVVSLQPPCAYHLALGMPQLASSHGLLQCRDLARDSKAGTRVSDSKAPKDKKPRKGGGRGPRPKLADAHSTEQFETSDDDEQPTLHATQSYSSGSQLSSVNHLSNSQYDADRIHFDSCANGCTVRSEALICGSVSTTGRLNRLYGSIPGHLDVHTHGSFAVFGIAPVSPLFQKNILAQNVAEQAGYKVFYDNKAKAYILRKTGSVALIFKRDRSSLFSMPITEFLRCFSQLYSGRISANSTLALPSSTRLDLTVSQIRRRDLVVSDHRGPLLHLSMHKTLLGLKSGTLLNSPYTEFDALNAVDTMPCNDCTLVRGTRPPAIGSFPMPPTAAGQYLAGDIFYVWNKPFLLITDRLTKFKIVVSLAAKTMHAVQGGIRKILDVWKGFKCTPQFLSFDREKSVLALQADLWKTDSLQILAQPPEGHEKLAEREVRTIKEQLYANLVNLPCRLPRTAVTGLISDIVTLQNSVPNNETFPNTPRSILTGERLDLAKWSAFSAGSFGHFYVPYNGGKGQRYELGYILCHDNYLPKVLLLPKGEVTVIRDRRFQVVAPTSAHYRMLDDLCSGQDKAFYEDLFQELQEDFGSAPVIEENFSSPPSV